MALKRLTDPEKPVVTRCRASELMTDFYLLGDEIDQGFGSGLWDHKGLIYDSEKWSTQWKNNNSNFKEGNNLTMCAEDIAEEHKLDNGEFFILKDNQLFER